MKVEKRDGRRVDFKKSKIREAIHSASTSVGLDGQVSRPLTAEVVDKIFDRYEDDTPTVEEIQDIVEETLIENNHTDIARSYILYRKQHSNIRNISNLIRDIGLIDDYLGEKSWRVRENSNIDYSLQGLNLHVQEEVVSNYWLNKIYTKKIRKRHEDGAFHIHDLGILGPYCVGWDLKDLILQGFQGAPGKVQSEPARHFDTLLLQMSNFIYCLQNEAAGAQAFSNVDTLLAPFVREDNLNYHQVKQGIQKLLFNLNVATRSGGQPPFSNFTLDLTVPKHLEKDQVIVGGEMKNSTYGEYQKEVDWINKALAEVMCEGDAKGRPFTFPIPTYNITEDFDWNRDSLEPIWEMTRRYGIPYFSNFVGSEMNPEDSRSMCCRLQIDNTELKKRGGGLFGANPKTGSIGVVTLNLPRLGYISESEAGFLDRLEELMKIARDSLQIKRELLEGLTEDGLYPYTQFYLQDVKENRGSFWFNHFSTIGLVGMNEACLNMLGKPIGTEEGHEFALKTLRVMRERILEFQKDTGNLFNLEATPAEGTSYRLARIDQNKFDEIKIYNQETYGQDAEPYYTNSTHLPVDCTGDLFKELDHQDPLQTKYTGGTVFHAFLGEELPSIRTTRRLVRTIVENYKLPYFTLTPTFSICPNCGHLKGEVRTCPTCGSECEVWSRVVGYLRPTSQYNDGKREEYEERKTFRVNREH